MTMEATRERAEGKTSVSSRLSLPDGARVLTGRWPWLRHWEFWLALLMGAFPRLWHLGYSQLLDDQAMLLRMARGSVVRHAIPITGIPSSIGTLNPPLSVYLLIPFVWTGKDPSPAIASLALWNVLGVGLCYVFAWRYFGRRVAAIGTLLFATSGAAVDFSRFLWQQNYMPPLLILWALATFAGGVRGSRGWLFASVTLLAAATLLHPTALLLAPVVLAALVLAPRKPRIWEYPALVAVLLALAAPTLLWEHISGFSDMRTLADYTAAAPQVNLDVLGTMIQVLGPPTFASANGSSLYAPPTAASPYASIAGLAPVLWALARVVYGASYAIVTGLVVAPIVRRWRAARREKGGIPARMLASWRALRADPVWCGHLLLWLCVTIVPAALIRHSSQMHAHYLHVLYPLIFILAGVGMDWLLTEARAVGRALAGITGAREAIGARRAQVARLVGTGLIVVCVGALVAGQALQSGLYIASQASGQVDNTYFGYPLSQLQAAGTALDALQSQQGASATYIGAPIWYTRTALQYFLVSEHPGRALFYGDCLVLPPPQARPTLIVSTHAESAMAGLLARLPNVRLLRTLEMPGSEPFQVYRVTGGTPPLAHEAPVPSLIFQDGFGNTMRLEGVALEDRGTLRLRWSVVHMASSTNVGVAGVFAVDGRAARAGAGSGPALAHGECDATEWQPGATIFSWVATAAVTPPSQAAAPLPATVAVSAWDQKVAFAAPVRHGIAFLTSDRVYQSPAQLVAMHAQGKALPVGQDTVSGGELIVSLAQFAVP